MHHRERHLRREADGACRAERRDVDHIASRHAAQACGRVHDRIHFGDHPRGRRSRSDRQDPGIHSVPQDIQGFQRPRRWMSGQGPGGDADGPRARRLLGRVHALRRLQMEDAVQREREIRGILRFRARIRSRESGPLDQGGRRQLHPGAPDRMRRPGRFQYARGRRREARRFGNALRRRQTRGPFRPGEHVPRHHTGRLRLDVHGAHTRDRSSRGPSRHAAQGQAGRRQGSAKLTRASSGPHRILRRTASSASPPYRDPGIPSRSCISVRFRKA